MMASRKKKLPIAFKVYDPIYCCEIFVNVGGDWDDVYEKWRKRFETEGTVKNAVVGKSFLPDNTKNCAVWFPEIPGAGTMAHEAFHLSMHILTRSGVRLSDCSEEAWAYHIDWIVSTIGSKVW